MSDLPEKNQNAENAAEENKTEPASVFDTENSTIFVKHTYDTKKPAKKSDLKRIVICAVALVLCAAIVFGAVSVTKLLKKDNGADAETSSAIEEQSFTLGLTEKIKQSTVSIEGKKFTSGTNISSAEFSNYYSLYTAEPYFEAPGDDAEDKSAAVTKWRLTGIDPDMTLSDTIGDQVNSCIDFTYSRTLDDPKDSDFAACGLDDPTRTFTVKFVDGTDDLVIKIGKQLAGGNSNYATVSGYDKIFISPSSYVAKLDCLPVDYADTEVTAPIEQNDGTASYYNDKEALATFDYIKLSGRIFKNKPVTIALSTGASSKYMPYTMTAPYNRPVSEQYVQNFLDLCTNGITSTGLFSFNATAENRETCGLNDPNCIIEMKVGSYQFKLTIGGMLVDDSNELSAVVDGKQQIFKLKAEDFDFIDSDLTKMFNSNIIMEEIYNIKSLTVTDSTGTHRFDLKHTVVDETNKVKETEVKLDGKTAEVQSFKTLYQRILLVSLVSFTVDEEKADPILTLKYEFIENYPARTVSFTPAPGDAYHYIAWVDGAPMGEVLKATVDDIIKELDSYVTGGTVTPIS